MSEAAPPAPAEQFYLAFAIFTDNPTDALLTISTAFSVPGFPRACDVTGSLLVLAFSRGFDVRRGSLQITGLTRLNNLEEGNTWFEPLKEDVSHPSQAKLPSALSIRGPLPDDDPRVVTAKRLENENDERAAKKRKLE